MINLLPPQLKDDYGYARRNSSLVHVLVAFGLGFVGLILIVAAGFLYLQQAAESHNRQATKIEESLADQKQDEVEKEVRETSDSLKLAVQVLSQEVLFSELLKQLAVVTPKNVNLSGVSITEFGGGLDISAEALNYNAATQLQVNLTSPDNKIFEKADIVSISCLSQASAGSRYPCTVTIRALFAEDNPFLFINDGGVGR